MLGVAERRVNLNKLAGRIVKTGRDIAIHAPPAIPPNLRNRPDYHPDAGPLVDALKAAEMDADTQAIAANTIAHLAIALAYTFLRTGQLDIDPNRDAIRIPKRILDETDGMKLAYRATGDGDAELRLMERGPADLVIVKGD